MKNKIIRFPVSTLQRLKNENGPGYVPCMVSERWLQFPKKSAGHFNAGEFIDIQVMTKNVDGVTKKLCDLIITREDLQRAIASVETPE